LSWRKINWLIGVRTQLTPQFLKHFGLLPGVFIALGATEFIVLACCAFLTTRSPASYHRAVASESFLKTHAIAASAQKPWSPRAFQKISDSTAQWFPLAR
jgi:hypothetical protein